MYKATDKVISHVTNDFVRKIDNKHYYFKGTSLYFLFEDIYPVKYVTRSKISQNPDSTALTLDL